MFALRLLAACTPTVPVPCTSAPADDTPPTAPEVDPILGLDEVDGAVRDALDEGLVHPLTVRDWFLDLLEETAGLPGCPDTLPYDPRTTPSGSSEWYGTCTTEELVLEGGWVATFGQLPGEGDAVEQWTWLVLSFHGERTDGAALHAGGRVVTILGTEPGDESFYVELSGTFLDEGAEGPLAAGVSAGETWTGGYSPEHGLGGRFEGPVGSGAHQLNLVGVAIDPPCGQAPYGTLQLRDPSSGWWTVALDSDCSGCGTVYWGSEARGETCVGEALGDGLEQAFSDAWGGA